MTFTVNRSHGRKTTPPIHQEHRLWPLSELTIHNLEDGSRVVLEQSRPIHICNVCARNSRIYFNLMPVSGVQKTKVQKTEGDKGGSSHYFTAEW